MHSFKCYIPIEMRSCLYANGGIDTIAEVMLCLINTGKLQLKDMIVEPVPQTECKQMVINVSDDIFDAMPNTMLKATIVRTSILYFMQYEFWSDPRWAEEHERRIKLRFVDQIASILARYVSEGHPVENIPAMLQTAERTLYDYLEGKVVSRI